MLAVAFVAVCSCGDDVVSPQGTTDAPHSVIGTVAAPYNVRLEVPAIKDNSMFIVHYTDKYGVTYTEEYDKEQKTQRWGAYTMNKSNSVAGWSRNNWKNNCRWKGVTYTADPFQEDSVIPEQYRVTLAAYSRQTGSTHFFVGGRADWYNRGHIVNSYDRLASMNANGQTFYLSNMQPQISSFNSGVWEHMEDQIHSKWNQDSFRKVLYVCKGGTTMVTTKVPSPFIDDETGISIKVPRYFWMAVLCKDNSNGYKAIAFWAEHKADNSNELKNYVISIDELEERTGIDFYHNLDDVTENAVEASYNLSDWTW